MPTVWNLMSVTPKKKGTYLVYKDQSSNNTPDYLDTAYWDGQKWEYPNLVWWTTLPAPPKGSWLAKFKALNSKHKKEH